MMSRVATVLRPSTLTISWSSQRRVRDRDQERRKGRARGGFAEHEIIFDGQVLAYPWGEDRHGLQQAQRQAKCWATGSRNCWDIGRQ